MLKPGDVAPEFTATDETGKQVTLSQFKGKKVVLFFYPKDDTPGCTKESVGFSEHLAQFNDHNTQILGVSKDSVESHASFCNKYTLKVTLLSDPEMNIIEPYGVWQEKKNYGKTYMGIVRTSYLIDEKGYVQRVWKNVKVDGHVTAVLKEVTE